MHKIDMHTHILPEQIPDFAAKFGYGDFIHLDHHRDGFARMMKGGVFFREIARNCWDPAIRISEYALYKTPVQVVSTVPVMFSYWAKPEDTLYLSMFLNDHLAGIVDDYPEHYLALATIPMQDTALAIKELERVHDLGFPGIQIGSNVNQLNLGEPQFLPIFEACAALNLSVFVHPWEMMGEADMKKYWLPWLVGMPAETARAACSLAAIAHLFCSCRRVSYPYIGPYSARVQLPSRFGGHGQSRSAHRLSGPFLGRFCHPRPRPFQIHPRCCGRR